MTLYSDNYHLLKCASNLGGATLGRRVCAVSLAWRCRKRLSVLWRDICGWHSVSQECCASRPISRTVWRCITQTRGERDAVCCDAFLERSEEPGGHPCSGKSITPTFLLNQMVGLYSLFLTLCVESKQLSHQKYYLTSILENLLITFYNLMLVCN